MTVPAMENCLVTGATGFIGRVLCESLQHRGIRVRATARRPDEGPWDEFVAADLATPAAAPADLLQGVDTVFHLAGKAHALSELTSDDADYRRINVGGTDTLLTLATGAGVSRFVFFSSVKAAGDDGDDCMDEEWDRAPTTPYGRSKRESEQHLFAAGQDGRMHVSVLRLPLVYGRGVKGNLWKMMEAIARGRFPPLPENGNRRSMVHVEDAVNAAMLAVVRPEANGQLYIVTDGHPYSTHEIYTMMCDALAKPRPGWSVPTGILRVVAAAGDVIGRLRGRRFVFDSDAYRKLLGPAWYSSAKIERELGFEPARTLRDSVTEMVQIYRESGATDHGARSA
jgi:nucleoside-diphosphate-sugar epimerase